jgi:hypothetical protein
MCITHKIHHVHTHTCKSSTLRGWGVRICMCVTHTIHQLLSIEPLGGEDMHVLDTQYINFYPLREPSKGEMDIFISKHEMHTYTKLQPCKHGWWGTRIYMCVTYTIYQLLSIKRTIKMENEDIYIQA